MGGWQIWKTTIIIWVVTGLLLLYKYYIYAEWVVEAIKTIWVDMDCLLLLY